MNHVPTMPREVQWRVYVALLRAGITGSDLARAMNSRQVDLEETIEIGGLI